MLNVVNSVNKDSVKKAVNTVKAKREEKDLETMPIMITSELMSMLDDFQSVS